MQNGSDTLRELIEDNLEDWYQIIMTPPGAKIEPTLLTRVAKSRSSHNVDKSMLEGDLSLVDVETVMETRLLGAKALAVLRQYGIFQVSLLFNIRYFEVTSLTFVGRATDQDLPGFTIRPPDLHGIIHHHPMVSTRRRG